MQIHKNLPSKLCKLSSFLHEGYNEFESIANQIREKSIRMSVRSVALKARQYNEELNSQLGMLSINCAIKGNKLKALLKPTITTSLSDKKIIELCCNSEIFFSKAYNSVLNEYCPFKPLRDMLRYQLTGIY